MGKEFGHWALDLNTKAAGNCRYFRLGIDWERRLRILHDLVEFYVDYGVHICGGYDSSIVWL